MPGILPMKIIKMSSSTQTRIAQACDRCRSKKIRCDGVRPCCTQCANVGFECKTSDKLSRRAFPRGYTESLEEQVRALEAEVRELKILLDENEEKREMLSRIRSNSPPKSRRSQGDSSISPSRDSESNKESQKQQDQDKETLQLSHIPIVVSPKGADSYFMGTSSGRALVNAFKHKIQQTPCAPKDFDTDVYFSAATDTESNTAEITWKPPPRMVTDQLVHIFFQEWAPLFPILHRHTFLSIYRQFVSQPEEIEDKKSLAQLFLVFGIAAQSGKSSLSVDLASIESQWQVAMESVLKDNTLFTLQCLALAQIYCLQKGDHSRLLKYRGFAAGLSQYLGLHQSQEHLSLGSLTRETRKKVFWSLYTLDCFSAAQLGQPLIFSDSDIQCEYPLDVDDEYINENEILPNLSGEYTKISSALALFELAQILSRILKNINLTPTSSEISTKIIAYLQDELERWSSRLPKHLGLQFEKDKPSTGTISSQSPLLSLAYHYVHSLVSRSAIQASSSPEVLYQSSMLSLASSSKRTIQIISLLEERNMSFSFCMNRDETLMLAGFGLLFQLVDLDKSSSVFKNCSSLIQSVIALFQTTRSTTSSCLGFRKLSKTIVASLTQDHSAQKGKKSEGTKTLTADKISTHKHSLKVLASRIGAPTNKSTPNLLSSSRRATFSNWSSPSQISLVSSTNSDKHDLIPANQNFRLSTRSEANESPGMVRHSISPSNQAPQVFSEDSWPNLDFLPLGISSVDPVQASLPISPPANGSRVWERFVSDMDNGQSTIHDNIYGGIVCDVSTDPDLLVISKPDILESSFNWSPFEIWASESSPKIKRNNVPQSVLSFGSDETFTSGEDCIDVSGQQKTSKGAMLESFAAIVIPDIDRSSGGGQNDLHNLSNFDFT